MGFTSRLMVLPRCGERGKANAFVTVRGARSEGARQRCLQCSVVVGVVGRGERAAAAAAAVWVRERGWTQVEEEGWKEKGERESGAGGVNGESGSERYSRGRAHGG